MSQPPNPPPGSPYPPVPPPGWRGPWPPQPESRSKAAFGLGFALGIAVPLGCLLLGVWIGSLAQGDGSSFGALVNLMSAIIGLVPFAVPVVLLVMPRTRRIGLGMLAGGAALIIIGTGTCLYTYSQFEG